MGRHERMDVCTAAAGLHDMESEPRCHLPDNAVPFLSESEEFSVRDLAEFTISEDTFQTFMVRYTMTRSW